MVSAVIRRHGCQKVVFVYSTIDKRQQLLLLLLLLHLPPVEATVHLTRPLLTFLPLVPYSCPKDSRHCCFLRILSTSTINMLSGLHLVQVLIADIESTEYLERKCIMSWLSSDPSAAGPAILTHGKIQLELLNNT